MCLVFLFQAKCLRGMLRCLGDTLAFFRENVWETCSDVWETFFSTGKMPERYVKICGRHHVFFPARCLRGMLRCLRDTWKYLRDSLAFFSGRMFACHVKTVKMSGKHVKMIERHLGICSGKMSEGHVKMSGRHVRMYERHFGFFEGSIYRST